MSKPPEIPESMKAPTIAIMTGLRKQFPTVPEERFKEIVTKELARAAIEVATEKPGADAVKLIASKVGKTLLEKLRKELS